MNIKLFTNILKQFRDSKVQVSYVIFQKLFQSKTVFQYFYQRFQESNSRPLE